MFKYLICVEHELGTIVDTLYVDKDLVTARKFMKKVLSVAEGTEATKLLPHVVKLLAITDFITKKLSCWYLCRHVVRKTEMCLLAVNSLVKDTTDTNPLVRCLGIRTLACLTIPQILEHTLNAISTGLRDSNVCVRRAAVISCVTVFNSEPTAVLDNAFIIDELYKLIRDIDPIVSVNSLLALDTVLVAEGGVVINRNIVRYLAEHLSSYPEPQCASVLKLLSKYCVTDETEAIELMNATDCYLKSTNICVLLEALDYFLQLVSSAGLSHLRADVVSRARQSLLHLLSLADSPETVLLTIEFITTNLLPEFQQVFVAHYSVLSSRYTDPVYLKTAKIRLLQMLVDEFTGSSVFTELSAYLHDSSDVVSCCAVEAVGAVCHVSPVLTSDFVNVLMSLFNSRITDRVRTCVLQTISSINITTCHSTQQIIECVIEYILNDFDFSRLQQQQQECDADYSDAQTSTLCAILLLLTDHCYITNSVPYVLDYILTELTVTVSPGSQLESSHCQSQDSTDSSHCVVSRQVVLCLLSAVCKVLKHWPTESQHIVGCVLELSAAADIDLCDKLTLYYQLLTNDINIALSVLSSDNK